MRQLLRVIFIGFCFLGFISFSYSQEATKPQKFDSPEMKNVNMPNVTDAYPYISADGLRLYFTSNREGGHGRFFVATRKSMKDPFETPVVLSKNLTDGYYAGSLTADELTLCMVKSGKMFIATRKDMQSEFSAPILVKGISRDYHYGPAISPDGNQIFVMATVNSNNVIKIYKKVSDGEFIDAGTLPTPEGSDPGPGQFSKDGLNYYFSFQTPQKQVSIWRYTRKASRDNFVDLEELPVKVNALQRNFQPTINADASVMVYTTSQNNLWEEDDLVLVNDPQKSLAAPEQITSVQKNNDNSLTVMTKLVKPQIKTYPNPFQTDIILEMEAQPANGTMFILYDLNGRMIKQQRITDIRTNIQLGNLPSATYIYQVLDDKSKLIASGKMVKG